MTQPPLISEAGRSKSLVRKLKPPRMRLALASSCPPPASLYSSYVSASTCSPLRICLRASRNPGRTDNANSSTVSSFTGKLSCGRKPRSRWRCRSTVPASVVSSSRMILKSVVFPAPLGPTKPKRSPRLICSETSPNRMRPPCAFSTPLNVIISVERRTYRDYPYYRQKIPTLRPHSSEW